MNELPRPSMLQEQEETPANAKPNKRLEWKDSVETMKRKIKLLQKEDETTKENIERLLRHHKSKLDDEDSKMENAFDRLSMLQSALSNNSPQRRRRHQSTPNAKGQRHERQIHSTLPMTVPKNRTATAGFQHVRELKIEPKRDAFEKRNALTPKSKGHRHERQVRSTTPSSRSVTVPQNKRTVTEDYFGELKKIERKRRQSAVCTTRKLSSQRDSTPITERREERPMHSTTTTISARSKKTAADNSADVTSAVLGDAEEPKAEEEKKIRDPFDRLNVMRSHALDETTYETQRLR